MCYRSWRIRTCVSYCVKKESGLCVLCVLAVCMFMCVYVNCRAADIIRGYRALSQGILFVSPVKDVWRWSMLIKFAFPRPRCVVGNKGKCSIFRLFGRIIQVNCSSHSHCQCSWSESCLCTSGGCTYIQLRKFAIFSFAGQFQQLGDDRDVQNERRFYFRSNLAGPELLT